MENPFSKKQPQESVQRILPSDVRYAFQYKEAKLGISEMRDLIENGFTKEALYVILKGASEDPALQLHLLQGLADTVSTHETEATDTTVRSFLHDALAQLSEDVTVEAQKLALISRVGFAEWHGLYEALAQKLAGEEAQVFLLAHATFVGLVTFLEEFQKKNKPLFILVPDFFEAHEHNMCGYVITNGVASFLPKDFQRPQDAVVVDDVRHTGATADGVRAFWMEREAAQEPSFQALYETSPNNPG